MTTSNARSDMTSFPALRVLCAFFLRDFTIARSYRVPFVLDLGSAVLQVALFFFLATVVNTSSAEFLRAFEGGYFSYVVVGLIVMRTVDTTVRAFATGLREEQVAGTFESLMTSPTPLWVVVVGSAAYSVVYGVAVAALMAGFAVALGVDVQTTWSSLATAALAYAFCLAAFSGLGMAVAAFVVVFKQGQSVLGLVAQGLGLLAGVYFPVTLLPPFLQQISQAIPLTWALDALRGGLLGGRVEVPAVASLLVVGLASPLVAAALLRLAIARARREGTLGQY